jgi:hypothetical protein
MGGTKPFPAFASFGLGHPHDCTSSSQRLKFWAATAARIPRARSAGDTREILCDKISWARFSFVGTASVEVRAWRVDSGERLLKRGSIFW